MTARCVCATAILLFAGAAASAQRQFVVPNFPDLTIKIKSVRPLAGQPSVQTLYLKGARQRIEHSFSFSAQARLVVPIIMISQCDLQTRYTLHPSVKTYIESQFHELSPEQLEKQKAFLAGHVRPRTGSEVIVTYSSVDTSEVKALGSLQAHHIKTTITVEPSKGAETEPARVEADAWYLDVSGLGCMSEPQQPYLWQRLQFGANDRIVTKYEGPKPLGLVVEGSATTRQAGNEIVNKVELLEVSDQPLDDALFELPPDYVPATPGHQLADPGFMIPVTK